MENGDAKPTNGAYKVFDELSKELEGHLNKLNTTINADLPKLNQQLSGKSLKPIADGKA
jgi:hypothetical protein